MAMTLPMARDLGMRGREEREGLSSFCCCCCCCCCCGGGGGGAAGGVVVNVVS